MQVWALTGGMGSGKSTVARLLQAHQIPVIFADQLVKEVLEFPEIKAKVAQKFGSDLLDDNGQLHRQRLAERAFSSASQKTALETILHPHIRKLYADKIKVLHTHGHPVAVYEIPLLFENKLEREFDRIILVMADQRLRLDRAAARDNLSENEILARMRHQSDHNENIARADYIIWNHGSLEELRQQVDRLVDDLRTVPPTDATRDKPI